MKLKKGDLFTMHRVNGGGDHTDLGVWEIVTCTDSTVKLRPHDLKRLDEDPRLKYRKTTDNCYRVHCYWAACCRHPSLVRYTLQERLDTLGYIYLYPEKAGIPYILTPQARR